MFNGAKKLVEAALLPIRGLDRILRKPETPAAPSAEELVLAEVRDLLRAQHY